MPKVVDPAEKRADLVAASRQVIAAEGLSGATLRRVAAKAGCTTGALTHYFADRQALLTAALRDAHRQAGMRMLEASRQEPKGRKRLEGVLRESLPLDELRLEEWRVWLAFWGESMCDPRLAAEDARRYEEWSSMLAGVVAPLVADADRVEGEVAHLIALVDGLGLRIARETKDDSNLELDRAAALRMIERHLDRLCAT